MAKYNYDYPMCPDQAAVWIKQSVDCKMIDFAENKTDAIHLAAEVGRLDIVSLIFAMFAIMLGVAAFIGFQHIRYVSKEIAKETSEKMVIENVAALLPDAVRKEIERRETATQNLGVSDETHDLELNKIISSLDQGGK